MSRFNIVPGFCGLVLALCFSQSHATSFDCKKASTFAEVTICTDGTLSRLDEQMNSEYVRALDQAGNKAKVRQDQRNWLQRRDNCTTQSCLSTSIAERVKALKGPVAQQAQPTADFDIKRIEQSMSARAPAPAPVTDAAPQVSEMAKPAPSSGNAQDDKGFLVLKVAVFVLVLVLLICIWLHRRGSMTIYQDYTDALWTSLTPILGFGAYWVFSVWLEIPRNYSFYAACVLAGLMSLQVIVQTYRNNGISLFFLLSLFAKIALLSLYFLMMAFLLFGGVRNKREARSRRGWAVVATTIFAFLSGWMCRNRHFSSIDDYIAGRT